MTRKSTDQTLHRPITAIREVCGDRHVTNGQIVTQYLRARAELAGSVRPEQLAALATTRAILRMSRGVDDLPASYW